jgi:hypothetical protein
MLSVGTSRTIKRWNIRDNPIQADGTVVPSEPSLMVLLMVPTLLVPPLSVSSLVVPSLTVAVSVVVPSLSASSLKLPSVLLLSLTLPSLLVPSLLVPPPVHRVAGLQGGRVGSVSDRVTSALVQ